MTVVDLEKTGRFIAKIRIKKGLKQEELGKLAGTTGKNISKWETGTSFPDITNQLPLCHVLGITLEELYNGSYNKKERFIKRFNFIYQIITCVLLVLIIPFLLFLITFFFNHYHKDHLYEILVTNREVIASGFIAKSNNANIVYVGSIKLINNKYDTDSFDLYLYNKDRIIYHQNGLDEFTVKYKDINKNNLKIELDLNGNKIISFPLSAYEINLKEYLIPFNVNDGLKNDIINKLKKNGFRFIAQDVLEKKESSNVSLKYNSVTSIFIYERNDKYLGLRIEYYVNNHTIHVSVYQYEQDMKLLFERYIYDYGRNNITCNVGSCYSLEEVLKIMEKYLNLFSSEQ